MQSATGSVEIDRCLGGGVPYSTLMLIEGQAASGKSTLAQQLLWGALTSSEDVALYATEQTVQSLLRQDGQPGLGRVGLLSTRPPADISGDDSHRLDRPRYPVPGALDSYPGPGEL